LTAQDLHLDIESKFRDLSKEYDTLQYEIERINMLWKWAVWHAR